MKAWKQYIHQQQARRGESATSQTVSTSDLDDCIASIKLFSLVQNSGPSFSQQPNPYLATSASQPTTIGIDVLDAKGKSISPSGIAPSGIESDFDTADPGAIQTSFSICSTSYLLHTSLIHEQLGAKSTVVSRDEGDRYEGGEDAREFGGTDGRRRRESFCGR